MKLVEMKRRKLIQSLNICKTSRETKELVETPIDSGIQERSRPNNNNQLLHIHLVGGDNNGSRKRTRSRRGGMWMSWLGDNNSKRRVSTGLRRLNMNTMDTTTIITMEMDVTSQEGDMVGLGNKLQKMNILCAGVDTMERMDISVNNTPTPPIQT